MPKTSRGEQAAEIVDGHLHKRLGISAAVKVLEGAVFIQAQSGGGVVKIAGLAWKGVDGPAL